MKNTSFEQYIDSWDNFRLVCENKVKGRCIINNDGWRKLRQFHLEKFLKTLDNPLMFLIKAKWSYRPIFESHRMSKYYYRYLNERAAALDTTTSFMLSYPSWRNNEINK